MPFVKVYIHFVWSTKNRHPFLSTHDLRKTMWQHIHENARKKDIYIDFISGYSDHCHCLVSLGVEQTIKEIAQLIKGESSFWINKQQLCESKFIWQDDYFAVSVSESIIEKTREYIKNQEEHHKTISFMDEYNDFLVKIGFERFKD